MAGLASAVAVVVIAGAGALALASLPRSLRALASAWTATRKELGQ